MNFSEQSYEIKVTRNLYSFGFDLKYESKPYNKYAVVAKITNNIASDSGLKVGDKIISINGEKVAGKHYIFLKNHIRKTLDSFVILEILKDLDFQLMSPETLPVQSNFNPLKLSFGRNIIPKGNIREKIRLFQNIIKEGSDSGIQISNKSFGNNLQTSSISIDNSVKEVEITQSMPDNIISEAISKVACANDSISISRDIYGTDVHNTISQDPSVDDSLSIQQNIVKIQMPSNSIRVIESKSTEDIKHPVSYNPHNNTLKLISEPFEENIIKRQAIPKLNIPIFPYNYSIPTISPQLSPTFSNNKSLSLHNLFEETTKEWSIESSNMKNSVEYGSMSDIKCKNIMNSFRNSKLPSQNLFTNIPIKLRIFQFHEKIKSKAWKDYIIESKPTGARFRKRFHEDIKYDKTNDFTILVEDINKFEVKNSHHRLKMSLGNGDGTQESISTKYSIIARNSAIHIKFRFNPSIFLNNISCTQAYLTFLNVINSFTAVNDKGFHYTNSLDAAKSSGSNFPLTDNSNNISLVKGLHSSLEELHKVNRHKPTSHSCKSTTKFSVGNLPITKLEIGPPICTSKLSMDIIKSENKTKVPVTYDILLDKNSPNENGLHFNRYIHEVPRMTFAPKIPMFIYLCTEIIEKIGLKVDGIYRISGSQNVIRTLSNTLNKPLCDIEADLLEWNNVHAVCCTLKLLLRKLKQCLIPADLSHMLAYSCKGVDYDNPKSLSKTLMDFRYHLSSYHLSIPRRSENSTLDQIDCRWKSLQYVLKHLAKVIDYRQFNQMDEQAIAVCFNPVIMESWQKNPCDIKADSDIMINALKLIVIHQDWLFKNWHSEMDNSWSSELVENAQSYATEFINRKHSFKNLVQTEDKYLEEENDNVNDMVKDIIAKATTNFGEKRKLERRHSSHIPGQNVIEEMDACDSGGFKRNSKMTEALDLSTCVSWMKQCPKESVIDESKEIIDQNTKQTLNLFELFIPENRILSRQMPFKRMAVDYDDQPSSSLGNDDDLNNLKI